MTSRAEIRLAQGVQTQLYKWCVRLAKKDGYPIGVQPPVDTIEALRELPARERAYATVNVLRALDLCLDDMYPRELTDDEIVRGLMLGVIG